MTFVKFLNLNLEKITFRMSKSEILTITVLFHIGGFKTFKHFYLFYVQKHMISEFPETVSYNRFVELMQSNMFALSMYMKFCCMGECTGISFIAPQSVLFFNIFL